MPLSPGTRLGPYEILSAIGAGGMGEVYKARDTRLDRTVAIKILPEAFAADADRVARFQREAKTLAALNHPNIAQIFGLEQAGDVQALAMEFVAGEDLSDRIARGPMPIDEALPIAKQIAEALEAAHEQGIIHRDLKPANVKVRPDGTVKVLDFGLARAMEPTAWSSPNVSQSPTITTPAMTQAGVILGTAAYMSPEQARGKIVDRRADIWAFGCVLYEMLTGQHAFVGETTTDVLASVVKSEPDWKAVPPTTLRLIKTCLEKDPKNRLRAIGDAWLMLGNEAAPSASSTSSRFSVMSQLAVGMLVVVAAIASLGWWRATRPVERSLVRLDVDLGSDVGLGTPFGNDAIISPDGTRLVYVSQNRLFARRLDQPKAVELTGSEGAYAPFFSPDGEWVGFFTTGKLKKISVRGGTAIDLCDARSGRGASWGEDGSIIAALGYNGGLSRVPSAGGTPTTATDLDRGRKESTHRWPQVINGGRAVLFTSHTSPAGFDDASIEVMSFADGRRTTLQRGGMYGRYLPSGHLVYVSRGTLWAVRFDPGTLAVSGIPVPLAEQVAYSAAEGSALLDFSRSGTLLYRAGKGAGLVTVQWLDHSGLVQPLLAKPDFYQRPRLSPDGQRLALRLNEIWVYEWARDTMTRVTTGGGGADNPLWSVDGRYVVFEQQNNILWTRADGGGKPQSLISGTTPQNPQSFTADGKRLAFHGFRPGTGFDIWTVAIENDDAGLRAGTPDVFLQTSFNEREPAFSPDGRWLAYVSDESGDYQVYVRAFPDTGIKVQISSAGAVMPLWSPNGHELLFQTADGRIMAVTYAVKGDSFASERPRLWTEKRTATLAGQVHTFDIARDGQRVAALMPAEEGMLSSQNRIVFIENFFDELLRIAKR